MSLRMTFPSFEIGLGGIVRDHTGRMIMAFSIPSSCSSNNLAEALTARFEILWCLQQGFHNCYFELDSKLVVDMVRNGQATNLKIKGVVEDIIQAVAKMNCELICITIGGISLSYQ
ncbi:hypothetical protein KY290_027342 [Solanum tuberosum]|uniref:RNase H type-1 domain-containing protein n=1 Tax=Solanum tuberosum TaxID=4113 RepID=A0ABQ7UES6_SOLTU|nr:hypothetical protein KY290_027342 [Solanum tuberosum]